MKGYIFPGQGSQHSYMLSKSNLLDLASSNTFHEPIELLDDLLGCSFMNLVESEDTAINDTANTQPILLFISYLHLYKLLDNLDLDISFLAGHSLGEYSALVSIGSLKFEDALKLVHQRGKFMQSAVPEGEGAMLAVMGVDIKSLVKFLEELKNKNGICEIANDNSNGQIILSGDKKSIQDINAILTNNKKRSIFLPVSAPFHCSLMKPASEKMSSLINETDMKDSVFELVTNVTAEPVKSSNEIKNLLIK
mgnify:CR=1 FL=1